jgi:CheY-like chemotaxis protein
VADIRMPVMDGFALVRELKSNIDSAHIPVVAVTGLDSAEYRKEAAQAGCAAFFSKPIDASTFPKQLGEIIKQNKASLATK